MNEKSLNKFQQYFQQNSILISILFTIQVIIIVLAIFIIKNLTDGPSQIPAIPIFSLSSEIKDLPDTSVQPIESALHDAVILNNDIVFDVKKSDTKIREGTLVNRYFEKQNIHYINFVVDIPSLEQSYQIFHEWTDDYTNPNYLINRATMAMCVPEKLATYSDFECIDNYDNDGQKQIVSEFIKYSDFQYFTPFIKQQDYNGTVYINPINLDADKETTEEYVNQTKEYIDSLGISSDIFNYKVLQPEDINHKLSPGDF